MLPVAVAYAATLILFVLANRLTTAANAIFLQANAPLYVLLLGPWLLHGGGSGGRTSSTLRRSRWGLALFFVGSDPAVATAPDPPRGNLLALASGGLNVRAHAGWSALAGQAWRTRCRAEDRGCRQRARLSAGAAGGAALHGFSGADAAVILYLGLFQVGFAYWCPDPAPSVTSPAFEATSTMLQLEPAMSPFWTWVVHRELPAPWAMAGSVLMLSPRRW